MIRGIGDPTNQRKDEDVAAGTNVARMTRGVIAEVTNLHLEAFRGYMNTRIGIGYITRFINWFCERENAIALVAIDSHGKVEGYVVGTPIDSFVAMNRYLLLAAAAGIVTRPWLFFDPRLVRTVMSRLAVMMGIHVLEPSELDLPEPTMSLVGIAVSPSARGKKVGLRLMDSFEERASQLQMKSLSLSVYPQNSVARQLYEKCGWQPGPQPATNTIAMNYFRVLKGPSNNKRDQ